MGKVGEIGNIFNGDSINERVKKEKYENIKEGYDYIGTKDIDKELNIINYENGVKIPFEETKFKIAHSNSVLICSEGGSAGKKIGLTEKDVCFGNKLFAIECYDKEIYRYIFYLCKSGYFYNQFSDKMTGIIGGISTNKFKEILISLPPLAEQKRIVEKVDSLKKLIDTLKEKTKGRDKTREELKKSILAEIEKSDSNIDLLNSLEMVFKNFDTIVKNKEDIKDIRDLILSMAVKGKLVPQNPDDEPASVLLEKIKAEKEKLIKEKKLKKDKELEPISEEEKPFEIPDSWEWVRLGEISEYIQRGKSPEYSEIEEVPVISQKCVQWSGFDISKARYITPESLEKYENERFLRTNDLLWNSTGQGTLGRINVFENLYKYKYIVADSHVTIIRPLLVNAKYLFYYYSSNIVQSEIDEKSSGSTKQTELATSTIKNYYTPLPPLAEQKRIVEKVDKLMTLCDDLEKKIEKSQKEFDKILESAIKEVTANNAN